MVLLVCWALLGVLYRHLGCCLEGCCSGLVVEVSFLGFDIRLVYVLGLDFVWCIVAWI